MIERPRNMEFKGSRTRQFCTALYFAFSTLTFSHGQIIKSPLSKIVVVSWCFVVLVLVQSYGASLASILTVKRFQPSVTDLDQLLCNGDYVGYQEGSFVHSFLTRRGFSEGRLRSYSKKQEYAESLRKGSKNGGVSAIVDKIPFLTAIVSDPHYENEFQMLKRIYKTPGFGFVFPPGFPLVHNLSTAMLDVTSGDEGSPLMLMISISMSVLAQYTKIRVSDVQSPGVDDGNGAHEGSNQAQNSMGNGFVADRPLREIRIDDSSQDIHGSV
uniref:Ionotropic glutamate receptor C-terminal domain-containing protein n=1 Tax=Oryza meridionalis TaxID=40149 RepID=A0A0E0DY61_9ORYZ